MAIVIKTGLQSVEIPVVFGELTFALDVSDDNLERIYKTMDELSNAELTDTEDALRKGYDSILGEGTYDKLYEQTPSKFRLTQMFLQLAEGIQNEVSGQKMQTQQQKAEQYIRKNKDKKRKR